MCCIVLHIYAQWALTPVGCLELALVGFAKHMGVSAVFGPQMGQGKIRSSQKLLIRLLSVKHIDHSQAIVSLKPGDIRVKAAMEDFQNVLVLKKLGP